MLTESFIKSIGGKLFLRIDDLDSERKRPDYIRDVFETLEWLQISWDEGPRTPEDFESKYSQIHRMVSYNDALHSLIEKNLVFACTCSRKDLELAGTKKYPGTCREKHLPLETPGSALRIKSGGSVDSFVIRRKDGKPAYQLTSVVDDIHFGITHIVRGEDLIESSNMQIFLADQLGLVEFSRIQIVHHPLVTDSAGNKLSKSAGSDSLQQMRRLGITRDQIRERFDIWNAGVQALRLSPEG